MFYDPDVDSELILRQFNLGHFERFETYSPTSWSRIFRASHGSNRYILRTLNLETTSFEERQNEVAVSNALFGLGIGPKLYISDVLHGVLLMQELENKSPMGLHASEIQILADAASKIHSIDPSSIYDRHPDVSLKHVKAKEKLVAVLDHFDLHRHSHFFQEWASTGETIRG